MSLFFRATLIISQLLFGGYLTPETLNWIKESKRSEVVQMQLKVTVVLVLVALF